MARPCKLTHELTVRICDKIRKGLPFADACSLCDITDSTFYEWLQRGETGEEPFATFSGAVKRATAEMKEFCLDVIDLATVDKTIGWIPAAWKLERRDRRNFGRHDLDEKPKGDVDVKLLADELEKRAKGGAS